MKHILSLIQGFLIQEIHIPNRQTRIRREHKTDIICQKN